MPSQRKYHSVRRTEQARATRKAILDSAERLFYEHGYAATPIRRIASEANVSEETIYSVFGDKPSILKAIGARLLGGDDGVPLVDTSLGEALAEESELRDRIRIAVGHTVKLAQRGDFRQVVENALAADPRLAELADWADEQSYQDAMEVFELGVGSAMEGPGRGTAADLVWSILSTQTIRRLIHRRGWSLEATEDWLAELVEWVIRTAGGNGNTCADDGLGDSLSADDPSKLF